MTKSQEEFYKFVIAPDNFDAICDIVENFEVVQERLIYDFWVDVKSKCEELLKDNKAWKVLLSEFNDAEDYEFTVYRDGFYTTKIENDQEFGLSGDNLDGQVLFGLWIADETKSFNREQLLKTAKENRKTGWRYDTTYIYYKHLGDHFDYITSLRKIDPSNRESIVHQYASEIVNAVAELEPFINKYILKKK